MIKSFKTPKGWITHKIGSPVILPDKIVYNSGCITLKDTEDTEVHLSVTRNLKKSFSLRDYLLLLS